MTKANHRNHWLMIAFAAVLMIGLAALPGMAQSQQQNESQTQPQAQSQTQSQPSTQPTKADRDITRRELHNLDQYLDKHPEVSKELRKDPSLINNQEWVSKHPELQEWLKNHPHASAELREHPKAFMHREHQYESHERGEKHHPKNQ